MTWETPFLLVQNYMLYYLSDSLMDRTTAERGHSIGDWMNVSTMNDRLSLLPIVFTGVIHLFAPG